MPLKLGARNGVRADATQVAPKVRVNFFGAIGDLIDQVGIANEKAEDVL